ncbi:MAG: hypothetical protein J6O49_15205, partial [Bacteroidaceae bacterium]|nr:hypothetical protein [Bacteroidaceae bacterium]
DPYAIYIYNRSQTAGTEAISDRFALLSHSAGDYALAKAGRGDYNYQFLNGSRMTESVAADVGTEAGFTPTLGTFEGIQSQVKLTDEVAHTFIYKVYTNGGVNAIDANQLQEDVLSNDWKPVLPEAARTPLLNMDQYLYYEQSLGGTVAENDTLGTSLSTLYGLYGDIVYTHYTPYNPDISTYLVPNVRNATSETIVARGVGSNDATIGLNGTRPYNIIWYNDNMMKANGHNIEYTADQPLSSTVAYEWVFEGDDPYAIKIRNKSQEHGDYVHEATSMTTNLHDTEPTTFMLLNRESYEYGVFAKTGNATTMLSEHGNALTTSDPTKFVIFALSTNKVIYHLMIKNIGEDVIIPYRDPETGALDENHKIKDGTTLRDLKTRNTTGGEENHIDGDQYQLGVSLTTIDGIDHTTEGALGTRKMTYCYDAGHVSLGDALEVPHVFYRPNVSYDYYIEGVYASDGTAGTGTAATEVTEMNNKYKGLKVERLGEENALLDKTIFVNIVYNFMGGLDTNSGSDFVESVTQNKWYTFETNDATPMLAEYTGSLQTKSGYATH